MKGVSRISFELVAFSFEHLCQVDVLGSYTFHDLFVDCSPLNLQCSTGAIQLYRTLFLPSSISSFSSLCDPPRLCLVSSNLTHLPFRPGFTIANRAASLPLRNFTTRMIHQSQTPAVASVYFSRVRRHRCIRDRHRLGAERPGLCSDNWNVENARRYGLVIASKVVRRSSRRITE